MLSGGVDSTLAGTYLDDAPAVVMEPDAPELAFECEYANDAVELLDVDARAVPLREADYADQLRDEYGAAGLSLPLQRDSRDGRRFRGGRRPALRQRRRADALFGLTGTKGFRAAARFDDLVPQPMAATLTSLPGSLGEYVSTFALQAERARRPPSHPGRSPSSSLSSPTRRWSPTSSASRRARERARRQYEYVADRVEGSTTLGGTARTGPPPEFLRPQHRHPVAPAAYAHGKSLFAPFNTRSVATLSQSIPASEALRDRPALAPAVDDQTPPEATARPPPPGLRHGQAEGGGVFPRERFFESGCLEDVFDRYEPPSFVPESMYEDHVESWGPLTWNLVTWAIWRDQVLENDDLAVLDGTTEVVCDGDVQVDRVGDSGTEMRDRSTIQLSESDSSAGIRSPESRHSTGCETGLSVCGKIYAAEGGVSIESERVRTRSFFAHVFTRG